MKEEASVDQLFLDKVLETIEDNLANENFGVEELALEIGLSRSQLLRKLISLTGQPPSQMIKEFRLKRAREMLQNKVATAAEISYQVGFASPSYFNTCFNEYFGYPPGKLKDMRSSGIKKKYSISRKHFIIASAALVVIALVVIVYSIVSKRNSETGEALILDKSIAVLPFINDSEEIGNEHIINGIMEEILINLQSISELRVPGRTSVEQYRDNPKSIPDIASEMNVAYVVEGSGQKYGNNLRLRVQLVEGATDTPLWADSYDEEINGTEDIFRIQGEIATSIARELRAVITPEEQQLIEKVPTTSLTAWDYYQRGMNEYYKFSSGLVNREVLERAEALFHSALECDSTFALAYIGLAWVYSRGVNVDPDSLLDLAETALSLDDQLSEGYWLRGIYYSWQNLETKAIEELDRAIKLNPNNSEAYLAKGVLYRKYDRLKSIENFHKAVSVEHGLRLPSMLRDLAEAYRDAGFIEKANYYAKEAYKLDNSRKYLGELSLSEMAVGNYEKSIELRRKDPAFGNQWAWSILALCYLFNGQYEESLGSYKISIEKANAAGRPFYESLNWIGYAYLKNGYKEEAEYYFNEMLNHCNRLIESGRVDKGLMDYYNLAEIYAFRGEKDKAYENLRIFKQRQTMPTGLVTQIKNDPFFESIRDEPEFQQIVRDMEAKHQADHERVRQWLEKNDIL
jgi:TolB-like protein/AraC-like DNA-binding protein